MAKQSLFFKRATSTENRAPILAVLFLCFSVTCQAKDFGSIGATYPIAETDMLVWIKSKLSQWQENGKLQKHQEAFKKRSLKTIQTPKAVKGVHKTTEARTFTYGPSITVEKDIRDHKGNLIHKAGDTVNPLDKVSLTKPLIFFDAEDREQVGWAHQYFGKAKLILTNGSPIELMKAHQLPFYFDQHGFITGKLGIKQVPAKVIQQDKHLLIQEVKL